MSKSENLYSAARADPWRRELPCSRLYWRGRHSTVYRKADGAYLYDVDGKAYIDYVGSWGPMVLGHNHPAIAMP